MSYPTPTIIGDYELLEPIGDGAQGKIFKARCIARNKPGIEFNEIVALKILGAFHNDSIASEFRQMIATLRDLRHDNIVRYRDFFSLQHSDLGETTCVVLDFLDGTTLQQQIATQTEGLEWENVKAIFSQCFSALISVRERGLTHRDLKPSNIFICCNGVVKVIDFEISRRQGSGEESAAGFRGSFNYMAPDFVVLNNFHGDEISDIFSLGVCLFQALTGRLPFVPFKQNAWLDYVNRWHMQQISGIGFHYEIFKVLPHAAMVLEKALKVDRDQRYQTFNEMQAAFDAIQRKVIGHGRQESYELIKSLGRGGFGELYRARRVSDHQPVAIKHLLIPHQDKRFIREATILRKSRHDHIVKYIDFIEQEDEARRLLYYLVEEFLEGMPGATLRERIKNTPEGLEINETLALFVHYLEGLQFLHDRRIYHRDIKPANLYAPEDKPDQGKIFDLGVAHDARGTLTMGQIPGTPAYMAPEFIYDNTSRGSPQSDIYSLGLSLYEALTGQMALPRLSGEGSDPWKQFVERARLKPDISFQHSIFNKQPAIVDIIRQSIAWDPAHRFRRAEDMGLALCHLLPDGYVKDPFRKEPVIDQSVWPPEDTISSYGPDETLLGQHGISPMYGTVASQLQGKSGQSFASKSKKFKMISALGIVIAVAIVALLLIGRGPIGVLQVSTTPTNAVVMLDGKTRISTPFKTNAAAGAHQLVINKPGYITREFTAIVPANASFVTNVFLDKELTVTRLGKKYTSGNPACLQVSVAIESNQYQPDKLPEFGKVKFGDDTWINSGLPFIDRTLPAGDFELQLQVKGYQDPASKNIHLEPGKTNNALFTLVPLPGRLIVVSDQKEKAEIWESGKSIGAVGTAVEGISSGKHVFELRMDRYKSEILTVTILPGEEVTRRGPTLTPLPGILTINCSPTSEVWENNNKLGITGVAFSNVSAGQHSFVIQCQGYRPEIMTLLISPGESVVTNAPILSELPGQLLVVCDQVATIREKDLVLGKAGEIFTNVAAGQHTLSVECKDYQTADLSVYILPAKLVTTNVNLMPMPGQLTVLSDRAADIFEKDTLLGKTGETITTMPAGRHDLYLSCTNYEQALLTVYIPPGQSVTTNAPAFRLLPGKLTIVSKIPAQILENGKPRGETGKIIENIPAGLHAFELRPKGYHPVFVDINIDPGKEKVFEFNGKLDPLPGKITFNSREELEIWENNQQLGLSGKSIEQMKSGPHSLEFRRQGYKSSVTNITMPPGEAMIIDAPILIPLPGSLLVQSQQDENIEIRKDGIILGKINTLIDNVEAGKHVLELRLLKHRASEIEVTIPPGGKSIVQAPILRPQPGQLTIYSKQEAVILDSNRRQIGETGSIITNLTPGSHVIEIREKGSRMLGLNPRQSVTTTVSILSGEHIQTNAPEFPAELIAPRPMRPR